MSEPTILIHIDKPKTYPRMLWRTSSAIILLIIIYISFQCANNLYRSLKCLFIVFATTATLSYTCPWTATITDVFMHILTLNKAITMWFSHNKAWYPVLNVWYSLGKHYITSIFNILFPEGPVLFDLPHMCNMNLARKSTHAEEMSAEHKNKNIRSTIAPFHWE